MVKKLSDDILTLYTDREFGVSSEPSELMPIVWAHIDKVEGELQYHKHHNRARRYAFAEKIEDADLCVLPNTWNTYVAKGKKEIALKFCKIADRYKKKVLVWACGDPEQIVPIKNAIQVQEGLHRNLDRCVEFAFERPGFVDDFVEKYGNGSWKPIPYDKKPTIGFVGMANSRFKTILHFYLRNFLLKTSYRMDISNKVPVLHGYPVALRKRVLNNLNHSSQLDTNFILRKQFKAGIRGDIFSTEARKQFIDNMFGNMYTVCVRGMGNFSKRFYETLSCGRIPVLVMTDSVLPFEEFIDWKNYIVQVDWRNIDKIADILIEFHNRHNSQSFEDLQQQCRDLWKNWLSVQGYYNQFLRYKPMVS